MIFKLLATAIMLVFYACYFAKLLSQRKRSIQTDLLGKNTTGLPKFIELSLKAATYLIVVIEAASIIFGWSIAPAWLRVAGFIIGISGVTVFIVSVRDMRDSWRAGVPEKAETELVTGGIYRYSRNPAFLGFDLIYIGVLCMFLNVPLLVATILAALLLHLQIVNVEEPFMLDAFGEKYLEYQRHTRRYLGRK